MPGLNVTGGPSQKYSGILDLRAAQLVLIKIITLEKKVKVLEEGWQSGDLKWSGRKTASAQWLGPCIGQTVSRTTFAELFAAIGITYGEGDKATTFNLPNGEGRTLFGPSAGHILGSTGGLATVKLTTLQIPAHLHAQGATTYFHGAGTKGSTPEGGGVHPLDEGGATQETGGGEAHENLPPFTIANLFIHI